MAMTQRQERRTPSVFFWKITQKIGALAIGAAIVASGLFSATLWLVAEQEKHDLRARQTVLMNQQFDQRAEALVRLVVGELQALDQLRASGALTEEQAKELGATLVRSAHYPDNGYFWVDQFDGTNVVLLGGPTEGKPRLDAQDSHGKLYVRDLIAVARQGGGVVTYEFPRPGSTTPVQKRGYALAFEPFGWVVGTGNYVEDIVAADQAQASDFDRILFRLTWIISLTLILLVVAISAIAMVFAARIGRPLEEILAAMESLSASQPDLENRLPETYQGEVGLLVKAFNRLMERLRLAFSGESAYLLLTRKLALLAEAHDVETADHTFRVGELSALLAQELGMAESSVEALRVAATLHDVGKLFVSPDLIRKQGPLTPEEMDTLKQHTLHAEKLLDGALFDLERRVAVYHHERIDGTGYPYGLCGDAIPIEAQIVGIADVFDALRSERPYKKAMTGEQALAVMRHGDGRMVAGGFAAPLLSVLEKNLGRIELQIYSRPVQA